MNEIEEVLKVDALFQATRESYPVWLASGSYGLLDKLVNGSAGEIYTSPDEIRKCITWDGAPRRVHLLDSTDFGKQLLVEFINIKTDQSLLDFVSANGLPFIPQKNYIEIDALKNGINTLLWLYRLIEAFKDDKPLLKTFFEYFPAAGCIQLNTSFLPEGKRLHKLTGVFEYRRGLIPIDDHEQPYFPCEEKHWTQSNPAEIERFAALAIRKVFDSLLSGIQPTLDVVTANKSVGFVPAYKVMTPWDQMVLALFEFAAGSVSFSSCLRCKTPFLKRRSDAVFCNKDGTDACRKWWDRNHGSVRGKK